METELKQIILSELKIKDLAPSDLEDDDPLFGGKLGLDSLDAIELVMILKKRFGIEVKDRNEARKHFESIRTLADFIRLRQSAA